MLWCVYECCLGLVGLCTTAKKDTSLWLPCSLSDVGVHFWFLCCSWLTVIHTCTTNWKLGTPLHASSIARFPWEVRNLWPVIRFLICVCVGTCDEMLVQSSDVHTWSWSALSVSTCYLSFLSDLDSKRQVTEEQVCVYTSMPTVCTMWCFACVVRSQNC